MLTINPFPRLELLVDFASPPAAGWRWVLFFCLGIKKSYETLCFLTFGQTEHFGFCEQIRPNMSRTAARAYVCSRLYSSRIPKAAKQFKQRDTSEKHFFAWSNGFSMILLAQVVLKPMNLDIFPLLSLRFFYNFEIMIFDHIDCLRIVPNSLQTNFIEISKNINKTKRNASI